MSDSEQVALALGVLQHPKVDDDASIQERFEAFHALNPWVYVAFEALVTDWVARGRGRIGIGMLTEIIRWQYGLQTVGDDFRINNNFRSRYVRLLIERHPEWTDFFETRALRAA